MNRQLILLAMLAWSGAQAGDRWGPYNAEFPAASDGLLKKVTQGEIFTAAQSQPFHLGGWFKPSEAAPGRTLMAGVTGAQAGIGWFLCSVDGKFGFCGYGVEVVSTLKLEPNTWTHLAASYDGRTMMLYANGSVVAQRDVALPASRARDGGAPAQVSLAPRSRAGAGYAGRIAGFVVGNAALDAEAAGAAAAAQPSEALINFETGSPSWPIQVRQMAGQVAPQDPWTLPKSGSPLQEPKAKPAYNGPALVQSGPDLWTLKSWKLQAAPQVHAAPAQISSAGFDAVGWYQTTTPGTVLTTLVDRGVYPDPDYGLNNLAIPESLNKQDYWYRAPFELPAAFKTGQRLFVTFKGVNYEADVWINGRRLGGMKGAFVRGTFDISPYLKRKGQNVIAVKVSPPPHPGVPQEESMSAGAGENGGTLAQDGPTFIASEGWDWIPSVRDRNTGLWQDVELRATRDLKLGDAQVITALPKADNSVADVSIEAPVTNLSRAPLRATVRATISRRDGSMKPVQVSKSVTLAPGEQSVRFTPADFAALRLQHPKLWWPNGYGAPDLHELKIEVLQGAQLSDQASSRFGARAVTYELSLVDQGGHLRRVEADFTKGRDLGVRITDGRHEAIRKLSDNNWATGLRPEAEGTAAIRPLEETTLSPFLVIKVNGVRIAARGGNWGTEDWRKRIERERLEPYFRLHRDANVNIIRNWVGQNTEAVFFDLADEYGLMVLNDFWASTQDYNLEPQDVNLFIDNARDVVKRYRNHPSVVLWFGRNEGVPQPVLNEALEAMIYQLDGTRWYTGSSNRINLQNSGPYNYQAPASYFTEHAKGFSVEVGTPSFPTLEALQAAVPATDQWPLGDTASYHDWHPDGNGSIKSFTTAMANAYGAPASLADFERKAQLLNYESHRAIFEGMNAGLWRENSGRMLWMTQPAWPSTMWQILSHDYDTHGAYYGVKSAAEPVHVQMNLPDHRLMVVNNPAVALKGATLSWFAWKVDGRMVGHGDLPVQVDAVSTSESIDVGIGALLAEHRLVVLKLSLTDAGGKQLSQNVYWPSATLADQQELNKLATVPVGVSARWAKPAPDGERRLEVTLSNRNAAPALGGKLTLFNAGGGRILPVYYSDNYLGLMPGEARTITVGFKSAGNVRLDLRGWNLAPQSLAIDSEAGLVGDGSACGTTPAPRTVEYSWMTAQRWQQVFRDQTAIADAGGVDLLFVGDSITAGWNKTIWDKSFGAWRPANFGVGGDHTGNVLWRLENGHADKLHPKVVVLTIGVNNFFHCSATPAEVFDGVRAVLAKVRALYPEARVLLNAVLPYDRLAQSPKRAQVAALNRMIAELDDGRHVFFHDYGAHFLQADGDMSPEVMADFLHPTAKGYQIWSDAMLPDLRKLMDAASIATSDPHVARMGRTETREDGAVRFGYPGVSFYLGFEGTRLDVETEASGDNSYLDVIVDHGQARKVRLSRGRGTLALVEGANAGRHEVEIVNRSETWHGTAELLRFDTDGQWLPAPELPERKLLMLGDSVTCGEAIDRVAGAKKEPSWWNARASYGMQVARQLHAQVQLVCYGGHGLVRTWDNKTDELNLADYYQLAIADKAHPVPWDQRGYRPDLIISAIGNNDVNPGIPEREPYVQAYARLVQMLLRDHPQAQIVLTEGGLQTGAKKAALVDYLNETVRRSGDRRVHYIASQAYPGDATDGHPTKEQTTSIANDLLPQVRAIMHW
ncbi:MAG: bifunctional acetylxylan esterase/glucomannan deacetylase AxeC2 [Pseudomonadota bacterium]